MSRCKFCVASTAQTSLHCVGSSTAACIFEANAAALCLQVGVLAHVAGCDDALPLSRTAGHLRISELAKLVERAPELAVGDVAHGGVLFSDGIERIFTAPGALDRRRHGIERRQPAVACRWFSAHSSQH